MTGIPIMPCAMRPRLSLADAHRRIYMLNSLQAVDSRVLEALNKGEDIRIDWRRDIRQIQPKDGFAQYEFYGPLTIKIQIIPKE